jgi:hypothetical protein
MYLLRFQKAFAPLIQSGHKPRAILAKRGDRRDPHPGDVLRLYVATRHVGSHVLCDEGCEYVMDIQILPPLADRIPQVFVGDQLLSVEAVDSLARAEGFENWRAMVDYFDESHGLPFTGNLVGWSLTPKPVLQ